MNTSIYYLYYGGLELGEVSSNLYNKDHDFKLSLNGDSIKVISFDGKEKYFTRHPQVNKVLIVRIDYDENKNFVDKEVVRSLDLDDVAFLKSLKI